MWGRARRFAVAVLLVSLASCGSPPDHTATPSDTPGGSVAASGPTPSPTPVPTPGHELYGFVPYWEMDDTIAADVEATPLSTVALFSVTNNARGAINTTQTGYGRITGDVGAAIIAAAHRHGTRVDLVYTSFGAAKNTWFFGNVALEDATIASLVALVGQLGIDGINVDVEDMDVSLVPEYGAFVGRLRAALVAADAGDRLTVSTQAGQAGAMMAAAAVTGGADRVFLMGYDYRTAGSDPGATSPLARADGGRDLRWSLDLYAALGVPVEKTLLGLPLFGMAWPSAGPVVNAPATAKGEAWILRRHLDVLANPAVVPIRDDVEAVEVYLIGSDGTMGPPSPGASDAPGGTWTAAYVDSPATLALKLGLGESRGLAGTGFWAIGYERGLPAYTDLMKQFVAGQVPAG